MHKSINYQIFFYDTFCQKLQKIQNSSLFNSNSNQVPLYLFTKNSTKSLNGYKKSECI